MPRVTSVIGHVSI